LKGNDMAIQTKSPVSAWLAQYLSHRPEARAVDAWRFLIDQAIPLGVPGIDGFDANSEVVLFRTAPHLPQRQIGRATFVRLVFDTRRRLNARVEPHSLGRTSVE